MSQFFRKIRNLFGEEIPKKAPPPTKLVSSKISSKNGSDGKTAASNQRNTSPKGQRKSFQSKISKPIQAEQPLKSLRFMRMKKLIRKTDQHAIDWGYVIGYINHGECPQSLGRQPQIKLEIGSEGDITALSALRPDALDSLIFYSDKQTQISLKQILHSRQRLLVINNTNKGLNSFISKLENILMEIYGDSCLKQFGHRLCFNLIEEGKHKIIQFLGNQTFEEQFAELMGNTFSELKNYEEKEKLMDFITIEQFQACQSQEKHSIQRRIAQYKKYIQEEVNIKSKKNKFLKLMSDFHEQYRSRSPSPPVIILKKEAEETDEEVLYFNQLKIENQLLDECGSTSITNEVIEDLYYFIQQHQEDQQALKAETLKNRSSEMKVEQRFMDSLPARSTRSLSGSKIGQQEQFSVMQDL